MAKRSRETRRHKAAAPGTYSPRSADEKRLEQALRRLDLVDSRLGLEQWADQVATYVGDAEVDTWGFRESQNVSEEYDFTYSSFERAMRYRADVQAWMESR